MDKNKENTSHRRFLVLVKHLGRICNHRLYVLEGIRVIAYRNMDHLTRAMRSLGIDRITTDASHTAVQNRIMLDQGLQPTGKDRWLLGYASGSSRPLRQPHDRLLD